MRHAWNVLVLISARRATSSGSVLARDLGVPGGLDQEIPRFARDDKTGANVAGDFCACALRDQGRNNLARHVCQSETSALELEREPLVIDSEQLQDGGLEVVDVDGVLGDVVPELVGLAVGDAALDPAAGHPDREGVRVM